jgi:hypothetical protein
LFNDMGDPKDEPRPDSTEKPPHDDPGHEEPGCINAKVSALYVE